jgi:hypothetical protein
MLDNPQLTSVDLKKVSFQNFGDDTNVDGYSKDELWTRSPRYANQVWIATKVGIHEGEQVYTLTMTDPTNPQLKGLNIQATKQDAIVCLAAGVPNLLAQQWILRFQDDQTIIISMKFKDYVLTGMGDDRAIMLKRNNPGGNDAQKWIPYNKEPAVPGQESRNYSAVGV